MSLGLYLHIPYCFSKCRYCDFYSAPGQRGVPPEYPDALLRELHRFAPDAPLRPDTIYFGGGTPSLLTPGDVARLMEAAQPRPNAVILGYPVVTAGQYAHCGSFVQLAGSTDPAAQQVFGLEDKITPQMPPVFVWTTMEDATVPVENTLMLVNALHRAGVPCEAHLFEKGVHGTSISTAEVDQPSRHRHHWVELAVEWLGDTFAFSVC